MIANLQPLRPSPIRTEYDAGSEKCVLALKQAQTAPTRFALISGLAMTLALSVALLVIHGGSQAAAQPFSPELYDPWGSRSTESAAEVPDSDKTPEQLTEEAEAIVDDEGHLLEARTKLLQAIRKDPSYYPAYLDLGDYYMANVGHFRLAMKYVKAGYRIFLQQNGNPPYASRAIQARHAHVLYLLSQARLNLDDYTGALKVLDEIKAHGYLMPSYPGSRAWVLMKLGRLDEAIAEAKFGLLVKAEPARTLNMLGILLSMNGEPESALEALKQAAKVEQGLGKLGQPATPINNMGEVYKEMFEDDRAEASWIKAKSLHDGCEHVLPSLNLALLYLDQLKVTEAKGAIDSFLSCAAQYTLRNDEEHRALVNLSRGRFSLHAGRPEEALQQLDEAYENIQWFGKIGTNKDDLEVALAITSAQAWEALANRLSFHASASIVDSLVNHLAMLRARVTSWWLYRKAARVLSERLHNLEDLTIRNTDSLIEYSTFGSVLSFIPHVPFDRRLNQELAKDSRPIAQIYYTAYRGENLLRQGYRQEGVAALQTALRGCRVKYDDGLQLHILVLLASLHEPQTSEYIQLSDRIFSLWRPALRNAGLPLPVNVVQMDPSLESALKSAGFVPVSGTRTPFVIQASQAPSGEISLELQTKSGGVQRVSAKGTDRIPLVNQFSETVFSVPLSQ